MSWRSIPIEKLELSVRSTNCLRDTSYRTAGDLADAPDKDLLFIQNFGRVSLREIRTVISQLQPDIIAEHDIVRWALEHQNLIMALLNGEAEIRAINH